MSQDKKKKSGSGLIMGLIVGGAVGSVVSMLVNDKEKRVQGATMSKKIFNFLVNKVKNLKKKN